jgi:outer membrane receptor protein involved in Fe transport
MQLFHNRYRDFIETRSVEDSVGLAVYTYGNIDDGTTRGVELEVGWVASAFTVETGWSFLDATDADTGEPLLGRARHSGRLTLGLDLPFGLRGLATTVHTGRTPLLEDEAGTQYRAAFTRMDARLSRTLLTGLTLGLGVDNVFDTAPESWPGYARRRVHVAVEVGHRWNP